MDGDLVEDVFFGCCNNVQSDVNVARVGLLEAGLPGDVGQGRLEKRAGTGGDARRDVDHHDPETDEQATDDVATEAVGKQVGGQLQADGLWDH